MSIAACVAGFVAVASAACILPESAEVDGSGETTGTQMQTLDCWSASLERYAAGAGGIDITVTDGDGRPIYHDDSEVTGEVNDSHDVGGAGGTWALIVDAEGFAGQFKITLQCY
jgi:hypothetical protein